MKMEKKEQLFNREKLEICFNPDNSMFLNFWDWAYWNDTFFNSFAKIDKEPESYFPHRNGLHKYILVKLYGNSLPLSILVAFCITHFDG